MGLTAPYRTAIWKGSFGTKAERNSDHYDGIDCKQDKYNLNHSEKESLVLAGTGFVFLACLMKSDEDLHGHHTTDNSHTTDEMTILENVMVGH